MVSSTYNKGVSNTTANAEMPALMDLIHGLVAEVRALRAELAESKISPWMTTKDAAQYLSVSRDTLDRLSKQYGHVEGGPVNVGVKRKVLRWNKETIDGWFRQASKIAAPKVKRRKSPEQKATPRERFDWSSV